MNPIQATYNWIKKQKAPTWYNIIMDKLWLALLAKLQNIGQEVINLLIEKIKDLEDKNMTGKEKFSNLTEYAGQIGLDLSKRESNAFLNMLVFVVKGKF